MKLNCETFYDWKPWFAWYPVKVSYQDCRWLERVERRKPGKYLQWSYRAIP